MIEFNKRVGEDKCEAFKQFNNKRARALSILLHDIILLTDVTSYMYDNVLIHQSEEIAPWFDSEGTKIAVSCSQCLTKQHNVWPFFCETILNYAMMSLSVLLIKLAFWIH